MKRILILSLCCLATLLSAVAQEPASQDISGTWHGHVQLNALKLNLVFHFQGDSLCLLDSPDQGAKGIEGRVKERVAEKVSVLFPQLMGAYTGELKDGKLVGTFEQVGVKLPLTLERGELVRHRPQTPQPPFPYETREVTFASADNATLAGTLTLPICLRSQGVEESRRPLGPQGRSFEQSESGEDNSPTNSTAQGNNSTNSTAQGKRLDSLTPRLLDSLDSLTPRLLGSLDNKPPCLLLVTGSGLQNRDEELFEHKPFAVIADYLARHGIATLRYDDRGFGQSTGNASQCTTLDFARDAEAGLRFLRSLNQFSRVGILGHSEGGSIAFMLAAERDDTPFADHPDFIVALAAPGLRGDSIIVEQTNALLREAGKPADMTVRRMHLTMAMQPHNAWYDYFTAHDPADDISSTRCPALVLNGSLDMQVMPESNLATIRQLSTANAQLLTKEYPGLNHLFQHATTGAPTEYGIIEETISPEVLSDIAAWVNGLK